MTPDLAKSLYNNKYPYLIQLDSNKAAIKSNFDKIKEGKFKFYVYEYDNRQYNEKQNIIFDSTNLVKFNYTDNFEYNSEQDRVSIDLIKNSRNIGYHSFFQLKQLYFSIYPNDNKNRNYERFIIPNDAVQDNGTININDISVNSFLKLPSESQYTFSVLTQSLQLLSIDNFDKNYPIQVESYLSKNNNNSFDVHVRFEINSFNHFIKNKSISYTIYQVSNYDSYIITQQLTDNENIKISTNFSNPEDSIPTLYI